MENSRNELEFENQRLAETISLAKEQLKQAKLQNVDNSTQIISMKQEMRENTQHSVSNLWSSEGFEDLAALSQYVNPIVVKIADYESVENRIAKLERLIISPYFARIDFKFEDEEEYEKIYIGRSSLTKSKSYEMVIYDWRSPIASVFYRFVTGAAFYESPNGTITGEVGLKRQYEINNGELEYFFDSDVQIIDEFLRRMLSQNTSSKMKTIVETIQKEQDIVIRDMENDLMMVQGVAGSGKTSVALHRAAYLMYQGLSVKLAANNIIIISPNTLFEQYISNVLPELGEDNVVSVVFEEILAGILRTKKLQTRNQFLEGLIVGTHFKDIIKNSIEFKTSNTFIAILNRFIEDIPRRWIDFEDVYYAGKLVVSKEELKDKLLLGRKEIPLGAGLRLLEDFIFELIRDSKNGSKKAVKNEICKFTELDVPGLFVKLFSDEGYFTELAEGMELPDNISDIFSYTQENLCTNYLHYDDAAAIAYLKLKISGTKEYKGIKQVVIDEAQDYYPLHYEIFKLLFGDSKYTILGDINQTLEKSENLSLYEHIGAILNKKKSILVTMNKSFRCTNEILKFSSTLIENGMDIESFNREGEKVKIYNADDQLSLYNMIAGEVSLCLEKGYRSIGLICKTERNALALHKSLKNKMDVQLIKSDCASELSGTFILPVYMSKGLEFDAVLICDADSENYHTEDDKKLLYIASTRALHRLNLFCNGKVGPPFITEC